MRKWGRVVVVVGSSEDWRGIQGDGNHGVDIGKENRVAAEGEIGWLGFVFQQLSLQHVTTINHKPNQLVLAAWPFPSASTPMRLPDPDPIYSVRPYPPADKSILSPTLSTPPSIELYYSPELFYFYFFLAHQRANPFSRPLGGS